MASPLLGRYLVRNPVWNAWLRINDRILTILRPRGEQSDPTALTARRLLLCVGGHLGDAVMATHALSLLKRALPNAEIGVLTGSWNLRIFKSHPCVVRVHALDHWKVNRNGAGVLRRWFDTWFMHRRVVHELGQHGYDAAIDLSAYYPNFAWTLEAAGIPLRIGFSSGGNGPRYTHPVNWTPGRHVLDDHVLLLEHLVPGIKNGTDRSYLLSAVSEDAAKRMRQRVATLASGSASGGYVVIHPGASQSRKEWLVTSWIEVARQLTSQGEVVILTGAGARQSELCRAIAHAVQGVHALCDLEWDEFRWIIDHARLVLSVDTVTMHLAGAANVPSVGLMTGVDYLERWKPPGDRIALLTHDVPCAPCFRSKGCPHMSCIRGISADRVVESASGYLGTVPT